MNNKLRMCIQCIQFRKEMQRELSLPLPPIIFLYKYIILLLPDSRQSTVEFCNDRVIVKQISFPINNEIVGEVLTKALLLHRTVWTWRFCWFEFFSSFSVFLLFVCCFSFLLLLIVADRGCLCEQSSNFYCNLKSWNEIWMSCWIAHSAFFPSLFTPFQTTQKLNYCKTFTEHKLRKLHCNNAVKICTKSNEKKKKLY